MNRLEHQFRKPAITALTFLVTSSGTRNIVSEDDLLGNLVRDDHLTQSDAREVLKALSRTTRLVFRQTRGDSAFYEISSEFLIPWITEKRQARERDAQLEKQQEQQERQQRELAQAQKLATAERRRAQARWRARVLAAGLVVAIGGLAWGAYEKRQGHKRNQSESADNLEYALLRSGTKFDDTNNIVSRNPDSADLRGNHVALTHLARALFLDPRNSRAARLTVKLLSETRWCPPLTPALKYGQRGDVLLATTWAPDGKIVSLAQDGAVLRADVKSSEFKKLPAQQLDPIPARLSSAAFSANGKWLLTVTSARKAQSEDPVLEARLWKWNDAGLGEEPGYRNDDAEMPPFKLNEDLRSAAWSPDGKWLIIIQSNTDNCVILNLAKPGSDEGAAFQSALWQSKISAADFSADGKYLITGSPDGKAALWNLSEPVPNPKIFEHRNEQGGSERLFSVAVNPVKAQFVTVSLDNVRLWNSKVEPAEQKPIFLPDPARDRIIRAAFSSDGNHLVTGTISGVAQIWDVGGETSTDKRGKRSLKASLGEPVYSTIGAGMVAYVGFSPAGDAFVTCDGPIFNRPDSLRFWSLPRELPGDVKIGTAKKRVPDWLPELAEAISGSRLTPHGYASTSAEPSLASLEKKIRASAGGGN